MVLQKGKDRVNLTNEVQIAAFKNAGYEEVEDKSAKKKSEGK